MRVCFLCSVMPIFLFLIGLRSGVVGVASRGRLLVPGVSCEGCFFTLVGAMVIEGDECVALVYVVALIEARGFVMYCVGKIGEAAKYLGMMSEWTSKWQWARLGRAVSDPRQLKVNKPAGQSLSHPPRVHTAQVGASL